MKEAANDNQLDIYDGAEWTEADLEDLNAALACGSSIQKVATQLCRSGTVDDVRAKAEELGLQYFEEPPSPPIPSHKITKAEVVPMLGGFGVYFRFDDGTDEVVFSGERKTAEWDAYDRIGEDVWIGHSARLRDAKRLDRLRFRRELAAQERKDGETS